MDTKVKTRDRKQEVNWEFIETDGTDKDFILLCNMLDEDLNEIVGGEQQREQYIQCNTLENIRDVVLIYDGKHPI